MYKYSVEVVNGKSVEKSEKIGNSINRIGRNIKKKEIVDEKDEDEEKNVND